MRFLLPVLAALLAMVPRAFAADADTRTLVSMPAPMQEHMLANMRDHLAALDEILASIAAGRLDQAAVVAEKRIGMSSLSLHGASHMAPLMPPAMQEIGTSMHRAASRFAIVAQDADVIRSVEAFRDLTGALQAVTAACTACHAGFRLR